MIYRFGAFELDEAKGELRRDGRAVAIQPKPLALLALLLRERERVVGSDEILATLWPDTVVTPGSLNRAVSHARRAIGDTHRGRFIRSVSRRGYRFSGDVVVVGPAAPAAAPAGSPFVGREDAQRERIDTLAAVLSSPSLSEAAARLGVHRNTIAYRVQRLEARGDWDLSDPELRVALMLAVRVMQNAQEKQGTPVLNRNPSG